VPQNAQKAASGWECRPHAGQAGDLVAGSSIFGREDLPRAYRRLVQELS